MVNLFDSELKIFWVVSTPTPENRLGQWLRNNWCSESANELAKSSQICFHTNQQWVPPCAQAQALLPKCDPAGGTSSAWMISGEPLQHWKQMTI